MILLFVLGISLVLLAILLVGSALSSAVMLAGAMPSGRSPGVGCENGVPQARSPYLRYRFLRGEWLPREPSPSASIGRPHRERLFGEGTHEERVFSRSCG